MMDAKELKECPECNGRGASDDPPWGITRCDRCNGRGRLAAADGFIDRALAALQSHSEGDQ